MTTNRLEDLFDAADDGASTPCGPRGNHTESEFDDLLDAWFLERRNSVEFEILLAQSRKMIGRLLADGDISISERKRARRLIRAIDQTLRTAQTHEE